MKRIALLAATLLLSACGTVDGEESYITDLNVCLPNYDAVAFPDTTSYGVEEMTGNYGSNPVLGQRFTVEADVELWGFQLYLAADSGLDDGVTLDLRESNVIGFPSDSSEIDSEIDSIPTEASWVDFPFDEAFTVETNTAYWITLTPDYYFTSGNTVGWLTTAGVGMAELESSVWSTLDGRQGLMREIPCI